MQASTKQGGKRQARSRGLMDYWINGLVRETSRRRFASAFAWLRRDVLARQGCKAASGRRKAESERASNFSVSLSI